MQDLYNATAALHLSIGELIEAIRTDPVLSNAEKLDTLKFLKSGLSAAQREFPAVSYSRRQEAR